MRFDELRVKISSLAAEGRIIRRRVMKAKASYRKANTVLRAVMNGQIRAENPQAFGDNVIVHRDEAVKSFWSLRSHNVGVGQEARCAQLALAFLRGRPYASCERANTLLAPDWLKVYDIAKRFSPAGYFEPLDFQAWMEDARDYLAGNNPNRSGNALDLPNVKKHTKAELEAVRAQPFTERLAERLRQQIRAL